MIWRQLEKEMFSACAHLPYGAMLARRLIAGGDFLDSTKPHLYDVLYGKISRSDNGEDQK